MSLLNDFGMLTLLNYQNRTLEAIQQHNKGLIVIPTGGGKTVVFMQDAKNRIANAEAPMTFVIVEIGRAHV